MKDVYNSLGVKKMSDLVLKEIYGRYEKKTLKMNKLKNIKWLKRNFWKVWYLTNGKINIKSSKEVYNKDYVMTFDIKPCRDERKTDEFRKN